MRKAPNVPTELSPSPGLRLSSSLESSRRVVLEHSGTLTGLFGTGVPVHDMPSRREFPDQSEWSPSFCFPQSPCLCP